MFWFLRLNIIWALVIGFVGDNSRIALPIWPKAEVCFVTGCDGDGYLDWVADDWWFSFRRPVCDYCWRSWVVVWHCPCPFVLFDFMRLAEFLKLFGVLRNFLSLLLRFNGFSFWLASWADWSAWLAFLPDRRFVCWSYVEPTLVEAFWYKMDGDFYYWQQID